MNCVQLKPTARRVNRRLKQTMVKFWAIQSPPPSIYPAHCRQRQGVLRGLAGASSTAAPPGGRENYRRGLRSRPRRGRCGREVTRRLTDCCSLSGEPPRGDTVRVKLQPCNQGLEGLEGASLIGYSPFLILSHWFCLDFADANERRASRFCIMKSWLLKSKTDSWP